uniref:Uncharacterized protein n=1 Tax=Chromera velia CCMP2878 TaxID=1169474 RepID=A0A0G4GKX6_9ALVE|eukprot:Cvel_22370.t1-p1 / transcript=Cvel_22370.t1 / gene=Cvel_22370 / organism=Chromera_velia_CCMP2878 / gene_product=hypothetical protein / transcript_product=hypothetical protein / location=Cvel_scaffold2192:6683-8889(-) / protein_length=222 / sequence_SO=supercontig / SO=protein_coding / is_pseudo=false
MVYGSTTRMIQRGKLGKRTDFARKYPIRSRSRGKDKCRGRETSEGSKEARIEARFGEVVAFRICRDALEILKVADKNVRAFQDLPGVEATHIDAVVPAILLHQFRAQSERVRQKAMEVRDAQTEAERYKNELNFLEKEIEKRIPRGLMSLMQALKHTVSHTVKQEVDSRLKGKGDGTLPSTSAPHPLPKEKSQHKESAPPGDAEKRGGNTQKKKKGDRQKKD